MNTQTADYQSADDSKRAKPFDVLPQTEAAPDGALRVIDRPTKKTATSKKFKKPTVEPTPMAAVATLKIAIDQQLAMKLTRDGDGWDLRGRWDKIEWKHYEALAEGIARAIAAQLKLKVNEVTTDCSVLIGNDVAEPRVIVEVPVEHKQAVATDKVWAAIRYVIDRVTGLAALESHADSSDPMGRTVAANDPLTVHEEPDTPDLGIDLDGSVSEDGSAATEAGEDMFDTATKRRLQVATRILLSKVGGVTLAAPCRIEVDGLARLPIELSGPCASKPVPPPSEPKVDSFGCYVDGFIRSRHTVYLIEVGGSGVAREVAMASKWEGRIAEYAANEYRGRKFMAQVAVQRMGEKFTRELVDLVPVDDALHASRGEVGSSACLTGT